MSLLDDAAMGRDELRTREAQLATQPRRYTGDVFVSLAATLSVMATDDKSAKEELAAMARSLCGSSWVFCITDVDVDLVGEPE